MVLFKLKKTETVDKKNYEKEGGVQNIRRILYWNFGRDKADLQKSVDTITAVRSIVLRTIRIRDQKVRAQIENNRSYGRIVYTLYWRSDFIKK